MPRAANFYYSGNQNLGPALGATLGRALFGDPAAAEQLALRRAQMEEYDAQAQEARSHAGLYDRQGEGVDIQNTASKGLPGMIQALVHPPVVDHPSGPVTPGDEPVGAPQGGGAQFDPQTFRNGLPALMAAMAQMQGDKVDPNHVIGGLAAMFGNDEFARRGMVGEGHTPGADFALTPERADQIAQQGYGAEYHKATDVARIDHATDIPVANIRAGADLGVARINHATDIPVAQIQADAKRDVGALGKTVGFSLVSDVLPGARMTSAERDSRHNAAVGGVSDSYHLPGDGVEAFDIAPGTGARTFQDAEAAMRAKYGSRLVEAIDETHRPGHGPHWHFAIADAPGGKQSAAKAPKQVSAASSKMLEAEISKQLASRGLSAYGPALDNIRTASMKNYQSSGNPADAVGRALNFIDTMKNLGARRAPDGHFYVQRDGQYLRVDVNG